MMWRMTLRRQLVIFVVAVVAFCVLIAVRPSPAPAETAWDAAAEKVDRTVAAVPVTLEALLAG